MNRPPPVNKAVLQWIVDHLHLGSPCTLKLDPGIYPSIPNGGFLIVMAPSIEEAKKSIRLRPCENENAILLDWKPKTTETVCQN